MNLATSDSTVSTSHKTFAVALRALGRHTTHSQQHFPSVTGEMPIHLTMSIGVLFLIIIYACNVFPSQDREVKDF